jgi:hypothetical protein
MSMVGLTHKLLIMNDFVLLFRQPDTYENIASESEIEANLKRWDDWFGGIAAQGRLVNMGIRLTAQGKVLKAGGVITDGPFVEIRERLNGFIVVKADSLEDATTLAHGCPILDIHGTVEIRPSLMNNIRTNPLLNESRFSF